jgi:peptidoglycan hydrolase CwlO-like protein
MTPLNTFTSAHPLILEVALRADGNAQRIAARDVANLTMEEQRGFAQIRTKLADVRGDVAQIRVDIIKIRGEVAEVRNEATRLDNKIDNVEERLNKRSILLRNDSITSLINCGLK